MNRKVESGNLYNKLSITENMLEGRKDANGNSIYINKAEVTRAINKLKNATGIFAKREAKMELNKVIAEEQIIYSDAETYYLYNQFKDPRNHSNFEAQFGKNYRILMQRLEESMSPELKKWADWQTDTFYPSLYDRYNKVYNKLYHTDLPWNRFYSGRMSYVDVENDGINLTGNVDSAKGKKGISKQISKLENSTTPNQSFIKDLKKRKLRVKDRLRKIGIHEEQLDLFIHAEQERSKKQMNHMIHKQKRADKERRASRKRRIHELSRRLDKTPLSG